MSSSGSALVVGGGIAGLQASLDLAEVGFDVYLVEMKPRIGGHAALLYEVSPTLEKVEELINPLFQNVTKHPNISILTYSEIEGVRGSLGNFQVKVIRKPRHVDEEKCIVCLKCEEACPVSVPKDYEMNLTRRKAIYLPSPYPTPPKYLIDREHCLHFKDASCHVCEDVCPGNAIIFEQKAEREVLEVDVIVIATGFKLYNTEKVSQYKYGICKNVITGIEYERLCNPNGPTNGKIIRISDGKKPESVAFILCVGSREEENCRHCCKIGCLNALKHAYILRRLYGNEVDVYICYNDIRTVGRAEDFYRRVRASEVALIHGEPSEVRELPNESLNMEVYDQATSKMLSITADLIVLEIGLEPEVNLYKKLKIPLSEDGFFKEAHPKLATTETAIKGIFLAGAVQEPADITETMIRASAAAMKAFVSVVNKGFNL